MLGDQITAISVHKQQRYKVSHLTFRDPLDVPPTVRNYNAFQTAYMPFYENASVISLVPLFSLILRV